MNNNSVTVPRTSDLTITLQTGGNTSLSSTTTTSSKTEQAAVDVIIVGAGLSGLQAAVAVHKAGLSCLVLEATDRVGGKCYSVPAAVSGGGGDQVMVELGGAWINDTTESCMWELAKRYGLAAEVQSTEGRGIVQMPDGEVVTCALGDLPLGSKDQQILNDLLANITVTGNTLADESYKGPLSHSLDKILFQDWIDLETDYSPAATWVMQLMTLGMVGARADEFSALHIIRRWQTAGGILPTLQGGKGGSLYLRLKDGAGSIAKGLANELGHHRILLNSPVSSITQHQRQHHQERHLFYHNRNHKPTVATSKRKTCTVTTQNGTIYHCSKVIISIPSPLHRKIDFSPRLPHSKTSIASRAHMGYFTKVVLVYDRPWWRDHGLNGTASSASGPITSIQDTCVMDQNQYSLSTFMTGPTGRQWAKLPTRKRMDAVGEHMRVLYGGFIGEEKLPQPLAMIEKDWTKDEWFEGAPDVAYPTDILKNGGFRTMNESYGHIHFVGTETSDVFQGYMEGAVRSGLRGAEEVVEALQRH